ncbi:helix-turn-helix domain-containing protein [Streptomyces antimycoticus]|uniref:helix-turn-helix domain-containing protein n=1 Tax=Streptomyces antimycoticus TaxID=68175 RepID=UPI000A3A2DDD|nr:helix-turn-helix transcriptional regulator [Streptomyces antimycoticus]
MSPSEPSYQLVSRDLLRRLMERTGTGQSITIRGLARRAGCSSTTVGNLLSGVQECVLSSTAHAICRVIGVDVLILFTPTGRSVPVSSRDVTPTPVRATA